MSEMWHRECIAELEGVTFDLADCAGRICGREESILVVFLKRRSLEYQWYGAWRL